MTHPTVGRCGDPSPRTPGVAPAGATCCALPAGHAGWHRDDHGAEWNIPDEAMPAILAAVDNALRNGSYMTNANYAFNLLCDRLGVDRDRLVFRPDWASRLDAAGRG